MPVRFRCISCRGKLSISRRKAGTQVSCPKCSALVIVPTGDEVADDLTELLVAANSAIAAKAHGSSVQTVLAPPLPVQRNLEEMPLFERPDFEKLLDPQAVTPEPQPLPLPLPVRDEDFPDRKFSTLPQHLDSDVVILSRTKATLIVVAFVVSLGLSFAAGFLVGR